jgi:hypothetical protein
LTLLINDGLVLEEKFKNAHETDRLEVP